MTSEQEAAVARAQAEADRTGKPWAVPSAEYHGIMHDGPHAFDDRCTALPECRRIDPAPAKGEAPSPRTAEDELMAAYVSAFDRPALPRMTLRQQLAVNAPERPDWWNPDALPANLAHGDPGPYLLELAGRWPWAYADAVLAAEGKQT